MALVALNTNLYLSHKPEIKNITIQEKDNYLKTNATDAIFINLLFIN